MTRSYVCPVCPHLVSTHRSRAPRTLYCQGHDCTCEVTTKWRYAWAVTLLALIERWRG